MISPLLRKISYFPCRHLTQIDVESRIDTKVFRHLRRFATFNKVLRSIDDDLRKFIFLLDNLFNKKSVIIKIIGRIKNIIRLLN